MIYRIPLKGTKQGHLVREIRCAVCDTADLLLPEHGTQSDADIIQCAACGMPVGAYKDLVDYLEGRAGISKSVKAVTRVDWEGFEYE
jgi:hypothetical protein